jgi:RimJ/RimL family protein N-acetyltransferase
MDPLLMDVPERIETEKLVLRSPRRGDGAIVNAAVQASLDELGPWLPWAGAGLSVDESEANCRRQQAKFILREDFVFLIFARRADGQEGELLGGTGLHRIDWGLRRFEIGYWRKTGCEGRGIVTEATRAMARLAFDSLGARRVELRMDDSNERSWKVAERAGFTLEGVLRRDTRASDGVVRDTRVYSRVRGVEEPSIEDSAGAG